MTLSRISRRTLLAGTGAGLFSLAGLAACGRSDNAGSSDEAAKKQASSMYTWISNENDRQQWEAFVTAAKKVDPSFALAMEGPAFDDYWTKVKTRMAASDAPGILTTQAARAQELKGILAPLDDLIAKHGLDISKYNKGMIEGMTVDGKIVAIPYDAEPNVLYYNKRLFKEAGLSEPTTTYTREQFLSDAKKLTDKGLFGYSASPGLLNAMSMGAAFANGHYPTADGKLTLTEPGFVSDVQWSLDLIAKEKVGKLLGNADDEAVAQQAFMSGKAAMMVDGPWVYTAFKEGCKDPIGAAVVPSSSGQAAGIIQGSGFGISAKCKDKDLAFQNIMKITTPEVVGEVGRTRGTVPSIESELDKWAEGKNPSDLEAVKAMLASGKALITTTTWNQVSTLAMQYSSQGFSGQKTAADLLAQIQQSVGG